MKKEVETYHDSLSSDDKVICERLYKEFCNGLPEAEHKVWHGSPVWFLDGNPIVGYHKLKDGVRVLFWSGQSFDEPGLTAEGSFKAAEVRYNDLSDINSEDLQRWLQKARNIQWDYKNIVKRKGVLERIT